MIGANKAGWPITAEHDREGDMENVSYWMFTCDTCGATFHHQEREHGIGVEPDMSRIIYVPTFIDGTTAVRPWTLNIIRENLEM